MVWGVNWPHVACLVFLVSVFLYPQTCSLQLLNSTLHHDGFYGVIWDKAKRNVGLSQCACAPLGELESLEQVQLLNVILYCVIVIVP